MINYLKKTLLLSAIVLCCMARATAQEKFTGIVEYKTYSYDKTDEKDQPIKMIIGYNGNKMVIRASFTDRKDEMILINAQTDSIYTTNSNKMTYERQHINQDGMEYETVKTDSFKTYFGYQCRGYRVIHIDEDKGYLWLAEDLTAFPYKDSYKNSKLKLFGIPYLLLSMEMYEDGQRRGGLFVETITRMDHVPDSLFDFSAFTLKKSWQYNDNPEPISDSGVIKMEMPAETIMMDSTMVAPDTMANYYPPKKPVRKTGKAGRPKNRCVPQKQQR